MSFITDKVIEFVTPKLPALLKLLGIIDLERYAHIENVFFDSKLCEIKLLLVLLGETDTTAITVSYGKEILNNQCILTLKEIDSSKPWVNNIVNDLIKKEQRHIKFSYLFSRFF